MRTLITGAGGQVGLDLARTLLAEGVELHCSDLAPRPAAAADLPAALPWHRLDVSDAQAMDGLVAQVQPERIIHLAAILSARGETMPDVTYRVNQTGLHNALESARKNGVHQLLFTSTIAVFGPGLPELVSDDAPLHPTTMYGVTKAAGEMLGHYYFTRYGLDFRGVRFPGLISPSVPGGGTSDYALFMYVDGVRKGAYQAFCRPDSTIPLMYMPDGVRALIELSKAPRASLTRSIYNIAAFSPRADDIAAAVRRSLGQGDFTFVSDPRRQAILDSWPRVLDDSNARRDWGWKPQWSLAQMTADMIPRVKELVAKSPELFEHTHEPS